MAGKAAVQGRHSFFAGTEYVRREVAKRENADVRMRAVRVGLPSYVQAGVRGGFPMLWHVAGREGCWSAGAVESLGKGCGGSLSRAQPEFLT